MTEKLIGNVGVTVLHVYDDPPGPDGIKSGLRPCAWPD